MREGEQCLLAILITALLLPFEKLRGPWGHQLMHRAPYPQSPQSTSTFILAILQ